MNLLYIDIFAGAGGVTTGVENAMVNGEKVAKVIAAVNHDPIAIASHAANHPETHHFIEDIKTLDVSKLVAISNEEKKKNPEAMLVLWASLECTNFSKAKGGLPREADSRTLANHLFRYIEALNPDYIQIENVEEFMSWGPLDDNGKPISRLEGRDYIKWVQTVKSYGYDFNHRLLNSADYGAHTSRVRFFAQFAKYGLPIVWPDPTHSKKATGGLFDQLKPWLPVREVLDLSNEGKSIFERNKPLSDNTLKRIYTGLHNYYENFLIQYYGKGLACSIDKPSTTLTTKDRLALISPQYIYNPGWGGNFIEIGKPCCTIIARQDKAPLYLLTTNKGTYKIPIYISDSEIMIQLKKFMAEHDIYDIKIRMITVLEQLLITGFPENYILKGSQSDQKKFIGNAVPCLVPMRMAEAISIRIMNLKLNVA